MTRVVAETSVSARQMARHVLSLGVSRVYSIGIYAAGPDLRFRPAPGVLNPVVTTASVTDVAATTVADPFMIKVGPTWHMFFEVVAWRGVMPRGEIGHAVSYDGIRWKYDRIVLAEPFHLSFPYVFASGSDVFMVPESWEAGAVRLYRGDPFPSRWSLVAELLRGPVMLDACPFRLDGRWWMPVTTSLQNDSLRLFHSRELAGPWAEHPRSPLVTGDRRRARAGGRVLVEAGRVLRFAQDWDGTYGTGVRAFELTRLDEHEYEERAIAPDPILCGSGSGWNAIGMHQIDAHPTGDGRYVACVDGWADARFPRRVVRGVRRMLRR